MNPYLEHPDRWSTGDGRQKYEAKRGSPNGRFVPVQFAQFNSFC
jgi:hypothetical protein